MKDAMIFAFLAFIFLLAFLYCLDLLLFIRREKKWFETATDWKACISELENKQKKAKHPQKKNYYLYLICSVWILQGEREKALRLFPFLRNDPLMGIFKNKL